MALSYFIDEEPRSRKRPWNPGCTPLAKRLFDLRAEQQISYTELARRSRIPRRTILSWRRHTTPNIVDLEACLHVLGRTLEVVRCQTHR
jgi:transcriptional regulator with XRE-family HTH domain